MAQAQRAHTGRIVGFGVVNPADAQVRWDHALACLQMQDFKRGWAGYPVRFELGYIEKRTVPR